MIRASIIIPAFNVERTISNTLGSALAQTFPYEDYEIIIVNDGSRDNTAQRIHPFVRENKNVKLIEQDNRGQAIARNIGMESSSSPLIILLDADDLFVPQTIESCVSFMSSHKDVGFSYSQYWIIDGKGNLLEIQQGRDFDAERLLHYNFVGPVKSFRRRVIEVIGGFNSEFYCEDYDFTLRVAEKFQLKRIPRILYRYIIHGGNHSVRGEERGILSAERAITESLVRLGRPDIKAKYGGIVRGYHYYDHVRK